MWGHEVANLEFRDGQTPASTYLPVGIAEKTVYQSVEMGLDRPTYAKRGFGGFKIISLCHSHAVIVPSCRDNVVPSCIAVVPSWLVEHLIICCQSSPAQHSTTHPGCRRRLRPLLWCVRVGWGACRFCSHVRLDWWLFFADRRARVQSGRRAVWPSSIRRRAADRRGSFGYQKTAIIYTWDVEL